ALTWEDAIRKMTALPANTIGMVDRGYLAPGMAADVTVFDPKTIVDRATYEDPAQLSDGVRFVLVNGVVQVRDGRVTGAHGGQIVTRSAHMPSRPMNPAGAARELSLRGALQDRTRIEIDIAQPAGAPRAKGSVRISPPSPQEIVEVASSDVGVLQTMQEWDSFTASGRVRPSGGAVALTVIVEHADPFIDRHPRTVTVQVQGRPALTGVLK